MLSAMHRNDAEHLVFFLSMPIYLSLLLLRWFYQVGDLLLFLLTHQENKGQTNLLDPLFHLQRRLTEIVVFQEALL